MVFFRSCGESEHNGRLAVFELLKEIDCDYEKLEIMFIFSRMLRKLN